MAFSFTWLGHSTFIFESDGRRLLIDPFLTNNPFCATSPDAIDVEYILLTHAHGDHVGDTESGAAADTLSIAQRTGAKVVCNFEMGNWFLKKGLQNVVQGNPGGRLDCEFFDVKFTKAFHSSSFSDGAYGGQPNGLIIRTREITAYHAGDTSLFGDMQFIGDEDIGIAFLPIGDVFTMGIDDSIHAIELLRPRYVFPMHYNTFPPITQNVSDWADLVNRNTQAQPIIIDPSKSYTF